MEREKKKYDFDIYGLDKRFSGFERRINDSDMLPENKKLAISFKRRVYAAGLMGKQRILKYEVFFKNYDSLLRKPFNKATREDLEEIVSYIKDRDDWKEATKNDFLRMLRRYYKIASGMEDEKEHPELVKWIKVKKEKRPPINWEDVPHWEDVVKMAEHTYNIRDRALVKSIWEAGSRIGEHLTLRVGDVEEVEHGVYLNIRVSKTELRKVFIRLSAPDILEWLSVHPFRKDKEAPLFIKINGDCRKVISHRYVYKMLNRVKKRAGIDKDICPHKLRHGSASYFSDFLSDSDMDAKFGWALGSDTKKRYTHKNPRAVEGKILKIAGIRDSNGVVNIYEEAEKKQVECYYCKKMNDPGRKICWNCKRILDINMAEAVQKIKESMDDMTLAYIEQNPGILKGFVDFISSKQEEMRKQGG